MAARPFLMPLLILAALFTMRIAALSSDSLFDPSNAHSPNAKLQPRLGPNSARVNYDERMIRAVELALKRAHARTTWHCWGYVKDALLEARVVASRPLSAWAKQAGTELCSR